MENQNIEISDGKWCQKGFRIEFAKESDVAEVQIKADGKWRWLESELFKCDGRTLLLTAAVFNEYLEKKEKTRIRVKARIDNGTETFSLMLPEHYTEKSLYNRMDRYLPYCEVGESVILPYATEKKRVLSFCVMPKEKVIAEMLDMKMCNVFMRGSKLHLVMECPKCTLEVQRIYMRLRSEILEREENFDFKVKIRGDLIKIHAVIDFERVNFEQFYWDIRCDVLMDGTVMELPIRNFERKLHRRMYFKWLQYKFSDGYVAFPYRTLSRNYAVTYRARSRQDCCMFILKEYFALAIYYLFKKVWDRKNVWLVYEKYCMSAQDNGFHFFQYCMNLPDEDKKHIYYVIDKKSSDFQYVKEYGNKIVQFLSLRHMIYLKAAKWLISSETKAHAYAWHSPNSIFRNMMKYKRNVFLQHGVIYFKQCHKGLRKHGTNPCDLFITSSEVEKQLVHQYFEYSNRDIAVTGLARWDKLFDQSDPRQKKILLVPTWRKWLEEVTQEKFMESEYFKAYSELLTSDHLRHVLESNDAYLDFFLHPKLREHIDAFHTDTDRIRLAAPETPMAQLIRECNMMVTDYSSATWDAFYLEKPVAFFAFDWEDFSRYEGSYIDIHKQAFGDCADTAQELVRIIDECCKHNFREHEWVTSLRKTLLPFQDHSNCERIYREICELE